MSVAQIEQLLREQIGLEVKSIGRSAIEAAVRARSACCRVSDVHAYWTYLRAHQEELASLIDEVVVPETWFFREAAAFELLGQRMLARMRELDRPVSVLCVPCATGEEAYSVGITLFEVGIAPTRLEVHGVDVSDKSLELARSAVYAGHSFRGMPAGYTGYFRPVGDGLQVIEPLRERVQLSQGNLLDPALLSGVSFDAIFCRNLLIYFDEAARSRAIMNLLRLLRDDGVLFVGHSEPLQFVDLSFRQVGDAACFAFEKPKPGAPHKPQPMAAAQRAAQPKLRSPASSPALQPLSTRKPAVTAEAAPTRKPAQNAELAIAEQLAEARRLADRGELGASRERCEAQLAAAGPSAELYCLLGVVKNAAGDQAGALDCFNKALYLDARHYESLIHLALISEHTGHPDAARQLRARAERSARKEHDG